MLYRHGDILLKPTSKKAKGQQAKRLVLAEGEATGHVHVLTSPEPILFEAEEELPMLLTLTQSGKLTHQEHKELEIEAGTYEVVREREYSYFDKEIEKVVD